MAPGARVSASKTNMPGGSFTDSSPAGPNLVGCLQACWRFKLLLTLLLNLFFWAGYAYLSHHALFTVRTPPLTWVDEVVPFQPVGWSAIYLSEFVFTALVPWLISNHRTLLRYAAGLLIMSGVCFLFFLFLPVASPRPLDFAGGELHAFILKWDGRYNAFPSLHAGFLTYTLALAWRMFRQKIGRWAWLVALTWATLVMISTIATRQHYFVDLVVGAIIGSMADGLAWRGSNVGNNEARITLRKNGATSQEGSR